MHPPRLNVPNGANLPHSLSSLGRFHLHATSLRLWSPYEQFRKNSKPLEMAGIDHADWRLILLGTGFLAGLVGESLWPLRQLGRPKFIRVVRNLGLALISMTFVRYAFFPFEIWAADFAAHSNLGIINQFSLGPVLKLLISLMLLEYTLYFWHYLNHRVPVLWRFHNVHHIDLDLDVSTALRFHFGELAISAVFRVGQIFLIGIDVSTLIIFETCITSFAIFNHSNMRIPARFDAFLSRIIVTPRMHGIHHSIVRDETDSNYGTILTIWDRWHRTLKLKIPQDKIVIGVPSYMNFGEHKLINILALPFRRQRVWQLPSGEVPMRNDGVLEMGE